jgi:hypothetical protein
MSVPVDGNGMSVPVDGNGMSVPVERQWNECTC